MSPEPLPPAPAPQLPVTLVVGFLGSGKTTLIRRVLSDPNAPRCAVVVNEFGAVGIDGDLVSRAADVENPVVELANGCICCEVQDDLRTTLLMLTDAQRRTTAKRGGFVRRILGRGTDAPLEHVLVEASGAASPGPAVQTFLVDEELAKRVHLGSVLAMTHADHVEHLLETTREAPEQIAYADRIVVNHADRVDDERLRAVERSLRDLNPLADVRTSTRADVPLRDWALAPSRADLDDRLATVGRTDAADRHTAGLGSISLVTEAPIDRDALVLWLEFLAKRRGQELMRAKGVVRTCGGGLVEVQGVYRWLEAVEVGAAPDGPYESRMVLIGRDLDADEVRRGWGAVTGG